MAGKYNKGRCRRGSQNSLASPKSTVSSDHSRLKYNGTTFEPPKSDAANETTTSSDPTVDPPETEAANGAPATQVKQGDLHLYPVPVKTQSGEKLELQLNPGDSVMDIRQFLLDAPETCYFTCYDLLLHAKDGSTYHLEDYNEISEVADITAGGCSLEMVSALYDERSIRAHVNRTRDLLSLATLHASLSTSLALQHEAAEHKDAMKIDVPELDGLGFMEDVAGSVGKLLAPSSGEIKSVESIVFSSLNPPPSYRRLMGDLIYLDIITLEGNKYCISGTTMMFYVNSTTGNVLDPRPTKTSSEATTLIGLLQKISSKFKKAFREIMERKSAAHPFENVQSLLPPNSWLGLYPIPDHKRDSARAEDAVTLSYGSELIGMQRDWNEELQSCREFPHSTPQERILRDRALYKVTCDFVDAATSGAIGVINRCIPPINPTDPECFHMYVHNNIFFSFAVDADIEQLSKRHASDLCLSDQTGKESVGLIGKGSVDMLEKNGGFAHSEKCPISVVSDTKNLLESNEDSAETKLVESEQATYASANNDLKGTKAYQEADVPGLYNLAMAIIDYRGHRVVAQSVLPGILQGDKSDSLLYGSVDNGKKICWNEDFHSKVLEAAKHLHLKEHKVLDGSGDIFKLAAPVECKGIVGSDDRHYLLDLMRVSPRDANYMGPGSRFCILRPEIITSFCQAQAAESSQFKCKSQGEADKATSASEVGEVADFVQNGPSIGPTSDDHKDLGKLVSSGVCKQNDSEDLGSSDSCEEIQFNPNVFTEFQLTGGLEEMAADEENVRKVGSYLVDVAIPKFIQDLCTLEVSPMDGQSLTEALHAHGINVRYIGKVANGTKHLPHLWDLCSNEIVVRSAKHILKDILRETEDHDLGHAICHFLNCFFGNCQAVGAKSSSPQPKTKKDQVAHHTSGKSSRNHSRWKRASSRKNVSVYVNVSSETLWSDIQEFAKLKYQFYLLDDSQSRVKKVSVLRNFCQKLGITVAARKYDLNVAAPFQTADVLNLQPVVKHSVPVCLEAKELVELGKVQLAEGMLNDAYTLFSEAFSILQQVTGPLHREVANCCRYLAMVLYHAGDMAGAIMQQHKELIINERCLGLDHPDTAHSYGNMALFYHGLNRTELALRHMSQALLLLGLSSGPDHPDVAATFINVAMMYQDIGKMNTALRYLQQALIKNERLLGEEHIQTAVCYHALAIAWNCMGNFKLSYQHEKRTYDILVKQLGEEDSRARDSKNWMKTFKMRELQKGQDSDTSSTQKAVDFLKANPVLLQAFQAAAAAGASPKPGASVHKSLNVVFGQTFPRGRGFDERAARAAAEARKKAAARRLAGHPHDVPVQALPPLSQLLNIINSETKSEADDTNESRDIIANGRAQDVLVEANKEQTSKEADQAPVGLGTGLTSLGAKKRKNKNKGTA